MAQPRALEVSFAENYAVLFLKNGENRIDMEFLKQFNSALDEIESAALQLLAEGSAYHHCHQFVRFKAHARR